MNRNILIVLWAAMMGFGCSRSERPSPQSAALSTSDMYAFRVGRPQRTQLEAATRIQKIASILTGRDLSIDALHVWLGRESSKFAALGLSSVDGAPIPELPELIVSYNPEVDEVHVTLDKKNIHELVNLPDSSEAEARTAATAVFDRLAEQELLEAKNYSREAPVVSVTRVGIKAPDEPIQEFVTEHSFTWTRVLRGVPFANAGVRITVDRALAPVRVRVGDVIVEATGDAGSELPLGGGSGFKPTVTPAQVQARFQSEVPAARVKFQGTFFVSPDGSTPLVIEPLFVIGFARTHQGSEDETPVMARVETWGFSFRDASAPAKSLDANRTPSGLPSDKRPD